LTETVALAHPLMPFETEEIYSHIPGADGLLAARVTPAADPAESPDEPAVAAVIEAVSALRAWRDVAEVRPGAVLAARLRAEGYGETSGHLGRLARLDLVTGEQAPDAIAPAAIVPVPGGAVDILPGEGLDLGAAQRKREQRRMALQSEIERAERKLDNSDFVAKAPKAVVAAEHDKLARLHAELGAM
ncbi:MAG: class I tRNA ligase family protein, partial [Solirubrobacteraceae bacterium]